MPQYDYDLFVIGGGSGGVRAARLSAGLGKRVAIAEEYRFGGTCVIRGCVPKKLLVYASQFPEHFADAAGYGWTVPEASFDWPTLIANKDKEIGRLEKVYQDRRREGRRHRPSIPAPCCVDRHTIRIESENRTVTADQILIATGGRANPHAGAARPRALHLLQRGLRPAELPKAIVIAGGGYIAVEFANIFHGLGVETTLIYRGREILSRFDMDLRQAACTRRWRSKGIRSPLPQRSSSGSTSAPTAGSTRILSDGKVLIVDQMMLAIGRMPNTENLGLEAAGVETGKLGEIIVDDYSRTNVDNIWAIGDVTNRVQLTPVAIHEAMCFVETAFKDNPTKPDHDAIPTAVFSQPEIGTVGLSEERCGQALRRAGDLSRLVQADAHTLAGRDETMMMKLVVDAATRVVVGAHILGPDAGEMAQLLGIAVKARLTKDDFDRTMALHPTAAEELVTMYQPSYRVKAGEKLAA